MHYRKLGRTGLWVSELCLGTMVFGSQVSEPDAIAIIQKAMDSGISFIDTADIYSGGRSEEIVGKAIKSNRSKVVLATKVGYPVGSSMNEVGLSRMRIMQGIEDSLRRLGTDYIDIYYAHRPDYGTPLDETLRAMDDLIRQGKVRYAACSNTRAWILAKALWTSDKLNITRYDCVQPPYNLLTRDAEYELLPLCASEGVGVCVFNPLAAGILTGKYNKDKKPDTGRFALDRLGPLYQNRYWVDSNFAAVEKLRKVAEKDNRTLAQFSLAWILANPVITSVLFGCSSLKQLEDNLKATDTRLTPEELPVCDEVWSELRPLRFFYGSQETRR